jgi:hypothetical protein
MFRPHEFTIRLVLEYFKGIYKLHLLESRTHFLHNTVKISSFLLSSFKILNVREKRKVV